jgi:hypothetical protein
VPARARVARLLGDRPLPIGNVARDRRLVRRALGGRFLGRVLVVGPGRAVRQALPDVGVDVAGTDPHALDVNVCSAVHGTGSLPPERWDTVVVRDCGSDVAARFAAVVPACRPRATLIVFDPGGGRASSTAAGALAQVAVVRSVIGRGEHRLWIAELRT